MTISTTTKTDGLRRRVPRLLLVASCGLVLGVVMHFFGFRLGTPTGLLVPASESLSRLDGEITRFSQRASEIPTTETPRMLAALSGQRARVAASSAEWWGTALMVVVGVLVAIASARALVRAVLATGMRRVSLWSVLGQTALGPLPFALGFGLIAAGFGVWIGALVPLGEIEVGWYAAYVADPRSADGGAGPLLAGVAWVCACAALFSMVFRSDAGPESTHALGWFDRWLQCASVLGGGVLVGLGFSDGRWSSLGLAMLGVVLGCAFAAWCVTAVAGLANLSGLRRTCGRAALAACSWSDLAGLAVEDGDSVARGRVALALFQRGATAAALGCALAACARMQEAQITLGVGTLMALAAFLAALGIGRLGFVLAVAYELLALKLGWSEWMGVAGIQAFALLLPLTIACDYVIADMLCAMMHRGGPVVTQPQDG